MCFGNHHPRSEPFDAIPVAWIARMTAVPGINQCGPMSVKAVREGRVDLKYDGWFVYGEVNADVVYWYFDIDAITGNPHLLTADFSTDKVE